MIRTLDEIATAAERALLSVPTKTLERASLGMPLSDRDRFLLQHAARRLLAQLGCTFAQAGAPPPGKGVGETPYEITCPASAPRAAAPVAHVEGVLRGDVGDACTCTNPPPTGGDACPTCGGSRVP